MKKLLITLSVMLLMLTGCQKKTETPQKTLNIVATYSIIADLTENIVKDKAVVKSMVPVGTDPHMYDPLPVDVENVSKADLVFYNGLNLETGKGWFNDLLVVTKRSDKAFALSENVEPLYLSEAGKETEQDPHAWLDIQNAIKYVDIITEKVSEADPENKDFYQANKKEYVQKLNELDQNARKAIDDLPLSKRILVTSEGAFKYFSKAYGFQAAYIWEINTDNQGTPDQMARIIEIIKENDVQALFVESSVSPKTMETVSRETGVPIKARIFTDSLGKKGEDGDTYLKMIQWNLDHIIEGLK